jgi:hypothetical protein
MRFQCGKKFFLKFLFREARHTKYILRRSLLSLSGGSEHARRVMRVTNKRARPRWRLRIAGDGNEAGRVQKSPTGVSSRAEILTAGIALRRHLAAASIHISFNAPVRIWFPPASSQSRRPRTIRIRQPDLLSERTTLSRQLDRTASIHSDKVEVRSRLGVHALIKRLKSWQLKHTAVAITRRV